MGAHGLHFAMLSDEESTWKTECSRVNARVADRIPCIVASVCDSHWLRKGEMSSASGVRGDPLDERYGGYNMLQPSIVCDLTIPGARSVATDPPPVVALRQSSPRPPREKRRVLVFAPNNDPGFAGVLRPLLTGVFEVDCVQEAAQGGQRVREQEYSD